MPNRIFLFFTVLAVLLFSTSCVKDSAQDVEIDILQTRVEILEDREELYHSPYVLTENYYLWHYVLESLEDE